MRDARQAPHARRRALGALRTRRSRAGGRPRARLRAKWILIIFDRGFLKCFARDDGDDAKAALATRARSHVRAPAPAQPHPHADAPQKHRAATARGRVPARRRRRRLRRRDHRRAEERRRRLVRRIRRLPDDAPVERHAPERVATAAARSGVPVRARGRGRGRGRGRAGQRHGPVPRGDGHLRRRRGPRVLPPEPRLLRGRHALFRLFTHRDDAARQQPRAAGARRARARAQALRRLARRAPRGGSGPLRQVRAALHGRRDGQVDVEPRLQHGAGRALHGRPRRHPALLRAAVGRGRRPVADFREMGRQNKETSAR